MPLLSITNLHTYIATRRGVVRCVDGVSLEIERGETLGLVGESGSGKSMTAKSILGLVNYSPGVVEGDIRFWLNGDRPILLTEPLLSTVTLYRENGKLVRVAKDNRAWRTAVESLYQGIRGKQMSIIFQDPQTSLNPFWTISEQIEEAIAMRYPSDGVSASQLRREASEWLERVKINFPERILGSYAHQLSGGMCQRVMIAIALASHPLLVIADEPTTGLDVTTQVQIIDLFRRVKREFGTTVLLISHDIGLINQLSDRIAVMYNGKLVEVGKRDEILSEGTIRHPYTSALLDAIPRVEMIRSGKGLRAIEKEVPDPIRPPSGCRFHPRCRTHGSDREAFAQCATLAPEPVVTSSGHKVYCWKAFDGR